MTSKLDFSAIPGHVEHEPAPEATATSVLDFSAIPGHVQHSDGAVPEATRLEQTTDEPATATWESVLPAQDAVFQIGWRPSWVFPR